MLFFIGIVLVGMAIVAVAVCVNKDTKGERLVLMLKGTGFSALVSVFVQCVLVLIIIANPVDTKENVIAIPDATVYATVSGKHSNQVVGFSYVYNGEFKMTTKYAHNIDIVVDENATNCYVGMQKVTYGNDVLDSLFVFGEQSGEQLVVVAPSAEAGATWLVEQISQNAASAK